jgi:uncharacterized protein YndB with AHSA1/START domain
MSEPQNLATEPANDVFKISRTFDTDRDTMFKLWTNPDQLKHWWGPKGYTVRSAKVELKPGGQFLYCLESPDGEEMWGKFAFREVAKPKRLVFVTSFSNAGGGITKHPLVPNWPREVMSRVMMVEEKDKTTVTVEWSPYHATPTEIETFRAGQESMQEGWTGTFDRLDNYLSTMEKADQ